MLYIFNNKSSIQYFTLNKRLRFYLILITLIIYICLICSTFHRHEQAIFHNGKFTLSELTELCILCKTIFFISSDLCFLNIVQLLIALVKFLFFVLILIIPLKIASKSIIRGPPSFLPYKTLLRVNI